MRFNLQRTEPDESEMRQGDEAEFSSLAAHLQHDADGLASAYPAPSAERILERVAVAQLSQEQPSQQQRSHQQRIRPVAIFAAGAAAALMVAALPLLKPSGSPGTKSPAGRRVAIETRLAPPAADASPGSNLNQPDRITVSHPAESTNSAPSDSASSVSAPSNSASSPSPQADVNPVPVATFQALDAAEQEAMLDLLDDQECRLSL